jgi:hypothetical protein
VGHYDDHRVAPEEKIQRPDLVNPRVFDLLVDEFDKNLRTRWKMKSGMMIPLAVLFSLFFSGHAWAQGDAPQASSNTRCPVMGAGVNE